MGELSGIRVLLVEDHDDALVMLGTALTQFGATVECAASARAALNVASRCRPDVLISDLWMADNGIKLAREIDVPAIAYSGDNRLKQRALDAGFARFFLKPVDVAVLAKAVLELVAR
jgi:CheY-like chemotaxis protein